MKPISEDVYVPFRQWIEAGLHKYANSKPVEAATRLADSILHYTPSHGWTWQHTLARRMTVARDAGVSPRLLLQRVTEHYALLDREPHRFLNTRAEHMAFARHVFRKCPGPMGRPGAHLLLGFGALLAQELGAFGIVFVRRLHQDLADHETLRRTAADFEGVRQ